MKYNNTYRPRQTFVTVSLSGANIYKERYLCNKNTTLPSHKTSIAGLYKQVTWFDRCFAWCGKACKMAYAKQGTEGKTRLERMQDTLRDFGKFLYSRNEDNEVTIMGRNGASWGKSC